MFGCSSFPMSLADRSFDSDGNCACANIRLFYNVFAYMLLVRIENILGLEPPEEQHGFRPGRKIEEHLLTTNILLDKATAAGRTIWIVSLDLSKACDRVHWPALWAALHDQGVSEHCIWL